MTVPKFYSTIAKISPCFTMMYSTSSRVILVPAYLSVMTMTVKPGDKVITSQYAGTKVTLEDVEYVVVRQNDILAIVE